MITNSTEVVTVGNEAFSFDLCRKSAMFGSVEVDQWWMPIAPLYRQREQRNIRPGNFEAICDAFWALCREGKTHTESSVQEMFLLARLVPFVRSQGSRRIVADAFLSRLSNARSKDRRATVAALDQCLQSGRSQIMTWDAFREASKQIIGPQPMSDAAKKLYCEFDVRLLDPARAALETSTDEAATIVCSQWRSWMSNEARRARNADVKKILDVLSYEARAQLHQCYSAVWHMLLIPHLSRTYALSPASHAFLQFWHLTPIDELHTDPNKVPHRFHGHVFGLHPAMGDFLRTATGRELVGDFLQEESNTEALGRLLNGICIALAHYLTARGEIADNRRSDRLIVSHEMIDAHENQKANRRRRRCRHNRAD